MKSDAVASCDELAGKILILDDLPNWREVLATILAADRHTVYTAAKPAEAFSILAREPIDVVILDLRLEDKDLYNVQGVQILQEIRAVNPRIQVFLITGFPTEGLVDKLSDVYHVDAFWLKNPVDRRLDMHQLRTQVRGLVSKSRQKT